MKLHDAVAEMQILKTICDTTNAKSRAKLLSKLTEDYFGDDEARAIFNRIKVLTDVGKNIPSTKVMAIDNSLSEAARALLSSPTSQKLDTVTDIEATLEVMERSRKERMVFNLLSKSVTDLGTQRPDLETVLGEMNEVLHKCHTDAGEDEIEHYSKANAKEICKAV